MKLTVVIVSYNVRYYLEQCIVSVQRATKDIDHEIYIVDNASDDDTVDYLRKRFGDDITIIESTQNLGFARANNLAIRQSAEQFSCSDEDVDTTPSDYILLLNPDTFIAEDSLQKVLDFMDAHPQAGGVGAKMHNPDGSLAPESRRALPTPWVSMLKMLGFSKRYYMKHLPWDEPGRIDVISGAFCMLRREAIDKVGALDEDFFMYGEDIDLSYRLLKGGYENWYVPADIVHYKGESTVKSSYRYVHVFYQAMLIFFRKHYGHLSFFVTLPIKIAIYFRAFIALLQMLYERMRSSLGFADKPRADVSYYFVGSTKMLNQCRALAKRRGLTATYIHTKELSSLEQQLPSGASVVYDAETFSFQQMIEQTAMLTDKHPTLGTYSTRRKMLITQVEIIKG
ncbi:MAG: glycosyltransferase family 2 protein [Prevotella sp.]|nr:glycosyltransferase family 2 protein [Prevotella sp.]